MAKGKKEKKMNLKLRRQLRKTLGCLFMVSALLVTAIPVQPLEAASEWDTVAKPWCKSSGNVIPSLKEDTPIYQTEDGTFQFAYVDTTGSHDSANSNKFAVVVGYLKQQSLSGGNLTIPNKVDAYVKYTDTLGSTGGYAAANKQGKPLYYRTTKTIKVKTGTQDVLQSDGTTRTEDVFEDQIVIDKYIPCSADTKTTWCPDGVTDTSLYYFTGTGTPTTTDLAADTNWTVVGSNQNDGRIRDANVSYIGKQYAKFTSGDWKIAGNCTATESVFGGTGEGMFAGNIINLTIGSNLLGIGDYAFYNCGNIANITFSDGLNTLGNWAFANCGNLVSVTMPYNAMISTLGHHAFYNCGNLQSFALPTVTETIGDSCFENCTNLKKIDLIRKDASGDAAFKNSNLKSVGYKAFKNCSSLQSISFPPSYNGADDNGEANFHLSTVQGCISLKYISCQSSTMNVVTDKDAASGDIDGTYGFDEFKKEVGDAFYFEAPGYVSGTNDTVKTPTHKTANKQHIAFKYYGEDKYEIVEPAKGIRIADNTVIDVGLVYAVNSSKNLVVFRVEDTDGNSLTGVGVPELTMPEVIGPYGIETIAEGSFNDNCWIRKVTIPSSVKNINANAFKGSHNLRHVVFAAAENIESIGENAFATQKIKTTSPTHAAGGADGYSCMDETFLDTTPFLSFSGTIENSSGKNTEPYKYAMKASATINEGRQPITYITYYSGSPSNLTVKYNPTTQMSELQNYPTKAEVASGFVNPSYDSTDINSEKYIYPYITDTISGEATNSFTATSPTENQVNLMDGVYNIKLPTGVESIQEGLFSGLDKNGYLLGTTNKPDSTYVSPATDVQSINTKSVVTIEPYTFAYMPALASASISGAATISDYAFDECTALASADIGPTTSAFGLRPFRGCTNLTTVSFPDSTYFTYADGIIYGLTDGVKTKVVECLESRGSSIGSRALGPDEFSGIKELTEEAFMDCDSIIKVDLSKSSIKTVPKKCFAEAERLMEVVLPDTTKTIQEGSFWNDPSLAFVTVPGSVTAIANDAFGYTPFADGTGIYGEDFIKDRKGDNFEFVCLDGTVASDYASLYDYIGTTTSADLKTKYSVMLFYTLDEVNLELIEEMRVAYGEDAVLPTPPIIDGYTFVRWSPSASVYNPIVADTEVIAIYRANDAATYTVDFIDWDDTVIVSRSVVEGGAAEAPVEPTRDGYLFTGWRPSDFSAVKENMKIYAQYEAKDATKYVVTFYDWDDKVLDRQQVTPGESAYAPDDPVRTGYTFSGWVPATSWKAVTKDLDVYAQYTAGSTSGGGSGSDSGDGSGGSGSGSGSGSDSDSSNSSNSGNSVSGNSTKYTVVVHGGSGSGEYTAGTIVNVNAYATSDGKVFDKWTSSSYGVGFVNNTAISTTFTMPANNVEITANFKTGGSSVSGNSRSTRRNSTTSVDISKSGISNKDLASAQINGSDEGYIIKITEDAQATAAVIAALEAKYGDLSNIAYLPMDISLYDSTGQTKITDATGITIDLTLPLPDELIEFAGNNKFAGVVNGQIDDMNASFTTIDGTPCLKTTLTHLSPYTIYVDKGNLTEGLIDSTPKTGDPIHPKWFLAIGLACISVILFCKKDKGQPKVKAA